MSNYLPVMQFWANATLVKIEQFIFGVTPPGTCEAVVMDPDGGSSSTVGTGAQEIPGHLTRHGGECYFLGSFLTNSVGLGCYKFGYRVYTFCDR